MMREVSEGPQRQYFRMFGDERYHIAWQLYDGGYYLTLCGSRYDTKSKAKPITE